MSLSSVRVLLLSLAFALIALAAAHDWTDGTLRGMDVRQYNVGKYARTEDHHLYTIEGSELRYVVDFGTHKLKTPINDPVRFLVHGEKVDVRDSDGKQLTGKIEERIRKEK